MGADKVDVYVEEEEPMDQRVVRKSHRKSRRDWQSKTMWIDQGPDASVLKPSEAKFWTPDEKRSIFPQVSVNSVNAINSVEQSFEVRYTLFLNVTISKSEFDEFHRDPVGFRPHDIPVFMPYNCCKVDRIERILNPDGSAYFISIQDGMWVAGGFEEHAVTFTSPMDLKSFPFDVQTLEMKFEVRHFQHSWTLPRPAINVIPDAYYGGNPATFQNVWVPPRGEWEIKKEWITGQVYKPNEDSWGQVFQVVIKVRRHWRYFMYRVVFLMCLLTFSVTFMFALDDIGDILSYMAGLLIASVAFLFTVGGYTPAVGYLTHLDKYLFASFIFTFTGGLSNVLLSIYERWGTQPLAFNVQQARITAGGAFAGIWAFGHVLFLFLSMVHLRTQNKKLKFKHK